MAPPGGHVAGTLTAPGGRAASLAVRLGQVGTAWIKAELTTVTASRKLADNARRADAAHGPPAEGVDLPLPSIQTAHGIEDAQEHFLSPGADLERNSLHASGQTCAPCGRSILPGEDVRRTASGAYQHELCELR